MNDQITSTSDIPEETRVFLDSLLFDANLTFTDDGQKEEMIKELYARLDYFLTSRIIESLPPEKLDEFMKMNEENKDQSEIEQFMTANIPEAQNVFQEAFLEFRNLYLGNLAVNRNAPQAEDAPNGGK